MATFAKDPMLKRVEELLREEDPDMEGVLDVPPAYRRTDHRPLSITPELITKIATIVYTRLGTSG